MIVQITILGAKRAILYQIERPAGEAFGIASEPHTAALISDGEVELRSFQWLPEVVKSPKIRFAWRLPWK